VLKREEGVLASYVYVNFAGTDIGGDIQEAKAAAKTSLKTVPPD